MTGHGPIPHPSRGSTQPAPVWPWTWAGAATHLAMRGGHRLPVADRALRRRQPGPMLAAAAVTAVDGGRDVCDLMVPALAHGHWRMAVGSTAATIAPGGRAVACARAPVSGAFDTPRLRTADGGR
jgi:hypothetical protein